MQVKVNVTKSGTTTSVACVSLTTFRSWKATYGLYISLQCCKEHQECVFRLKIDEKLTRDEEIQIDHWPLCYADKTKHSSYCSNRLKTQDGFYANIIQPFNVQVVQYLAVAPVHAGPSQLALPFIKSLVQNRIVTGKMGAIFLQRDGIDYGKWSYEAYFCRRHWDEKEQEITFDGGIVIDQTLVLAFPSATTSLASLSHEMQFYQPIGTHASTFREFVSMALGMTLRYDEIDDFEQAFAVPHSLLLHAPSGAGKSTLVKQIADEFNANLLVVDGGLLASPQLRLEDFFLAALRIQPCVLLLEDLELLFPINLDEAKYNLVCRLVNCIESIHKSNLVRVAVVGAVSLLHTLHSKVRQVFMEEVLLDIPDKQWTINLLASLLPPSKMLRHEFIMSLAIRYGQKPSNIVSIAQLICTHLTRKDSHSVRVDSFESEIVASAREICRGSNDIVTLSSSVPDISWADIGGLERVKQKLVEMVVWPLDKPQVFRRMGISPPLGMILHGPPGTGKTMLAKAAAKASGCNFLNLAASDLMKAEIGESEKAITRAFDAAHALSPCMIFIDEFQSLFGNRLTAGQTTSRMISQLLMELDALKAVSDDSEIHNRSAASLAMTSISTSQIFVLAATNSLSAIDPAFLQPGRFENVVYVGLPNPSERKAILEIQRNKMPWSQDVDLNRLVIDTDGASAASMIALCQAAAICAMQRIPSNAPVAEQRIAMTDFVEALSKNNFDFQNQ